MTKRLQILDYTARWIDVLEKLPILCSGSSFVADTENTQAKRPVRETLCEGNICWIWNRFCNLRIIHVKNEHDLKTVYKMKS
jgi:hypothetical protein